MANKKISELPFIGSTGFTSVDLLPIVTYYSAVTGTTCHTYLSDLINYGYWTSGSTGSYSIKANNDSGLDATGNYSVAEGSGTIATGDFSHSEGAGTTASGTYSHAEGRTTIASGGASHAEGNATTASGVTSHAEGEITIASGDFSHAEGNTTTASGIASHAEGSGTTASGDYSHSEGGNTTASGEFSHAEGGLTQASGQAAHAEGRGSIASGDYSHAEGNGTDALGTSSHSEGGLTVATGNRSHAEGDSTEAIGNGSHSEGITTMSVGDGSHSEGRGSIASGDSSHSEGKYTFAYGVSSHAGGAGYDSLTLIYASGLTSFIHFTQIDSTKNYGTAGDYSAILGGTDHTISGGSDSSVIIGGSGNTVGSSVKNSVILGGSGITANVSNTVYVPTLNIGSVGSGTSVTNIGIDSSGKLISGGTFGYKVYSAILTQSSTSAPTVTVMENTIGSISVGRSTTGVYGISSGALFTSNTTIQISNYNRMSANPTINYFARAYKSSPSNIIIETFKFETTPSIQYTATDDALENTFFEVRVYS